MAKNGYTTLNLPNDLVEELKVWRMAFNLCYGRTVSYAEMICSMIDSLDQTEPDVISAMEILIKRHPDLLSKLGKYRGQTLIDKDGVAFTEAKE